MKTRFFQIAALASFGVAASLAGTDAFPARASQQTQESNGAQLFAQNCARCHGETGTGGRGPDLTSPKRQAKWKDSDEKIVKQITNGGLIMPSFKKRLSPEQIEAIAQHVRTLKR